MTEYEIGDDEYEETEEVNTSYDQNQPIGDAPQALNTELSNSEPIDAETGEDFYTIQTGGQSPKIGEFQTVWKQLGYESTDSEYQKVKGLLDRSESPEHSDDLKRWAGNWGVDEDLVFKVFEQEFGGMYEEDYANESLNLDGTGVARATRGVNPNKTVNKIIRFIYVSKSDCPICKQYDGQSWAVNSPNRPVIPRLEKGNKSRPFTHPHCKCKWVNVFSDQEVKSSEVNKADFERAAKWYGKGYHDLPVIQQKLIMIDMLKQSLGMEADAEEDIIDPVPLASMAQMAFDAIKPMVKHKLGIGEAFLGQPHAKEHHYEIQGMLDDIVSKSLGKDEKKEIEESTELENDFSLNTLLGLIADRLSKKIGKKLGVESRAKEALDEYICRDCGQKNIHGGAGVNAHIDRTGHMNYDLIQSTEAREVNISDYTWDGMDLSARRDLLMDAGYFPDDPFQIDEVGKKSWKDLPDNFKKMLGGEALDDYTKDDSYRSECQICGSPLEEHPITEGNDPHEWLAEQPEDYKGDMSPANEVIPPDWYDQYFGSKEVGDFNPKEGYQEVTYCKLCDEILDVPTVEDMNKHLINRHGIEWISATEGGRGSGRMGHQKWMLAGESGEECPNCMMITEREDGKCILCGN